ncbi:MerR family transcriptional regulator [Parafrankia elaeagni]|uniref:MerR family transcriptional regulator n=1 Tax=Parafrankia elaeagni TaxID=222534 RepID=UPI000366302C|nr:MerR family transcriptional regulator [Parafrankia elaeagni]
MTKTAAPDRGTSPSDGTANGVTVEELSRIVGMSPRNIRAHQARKLLPPPVRRGRIALYDDSHVRRLRTIVALQRQGFNLVSIEAMLGARPSDPGVAALTAALGRLALHSPSLVYALSRHNVVARTEEGDVRLARPQVLRAALRLGEVGVGEAASLRVLVDLLSRLAPVAEQIAEEFSSGVLADSPERAGARGASWENPDQDSGELVQGIIELVSASFRVAVENCSESIVAALENRRFGLDLHTDVDPSQPFDIG